MSRLRYHFVHEFSVTRNEHTMKSEDKLNQHQIIRSGVSMT